MRSINKKGIALLSEKDKTAMLRRHIPYRLSLVSDGYIPPRAPLSQRTNQAFEAGAMSGRILLSLIGLGCNLKSGKLKTDRLHHRGADDKTDDVKAPDIGGTFVNLAPLPESDKQSLGDFIRGAHKACAHFTIGSDHKLDLVLYGQAAPIIFRLMKACFPNHPENWPKWSRSDA